MYKSVVVSQDAHGCPVCGLTHWRAVVEEAPDMGLLSVELLRDMAPEIVDGNRLNLGRNRDGQAVAYRIAGWDTPSNALIIVRVEPALT